MNKYIIFILCILFLHNVTQANTNPTKSTDSNIVGHVVDKSGEHIPYVTISILGTTIGTTTDATGHYLIYNVPEGKFNLVANYMGYKEAVIPVSIKKKETLEINFILEEDTQLLNEVVVSGNRNETFKKIAPTLMTILDAKTFENTNSCSLADGLNFQSGLRVENNCQSCGTKQVRMNGLGGAYSQILIDSRPMMSSLAGVYGLEQIPPNMIERVEITKGAGSALIGSSSIGGTINIITKEPLRNMASLSHNITGIGGLTSFDNNINFNASIIADNQKMGVMLFAQKRHRSAFDKNKDGFSDIPLLNNRTMGFRSFVKSSSLSKFTFEYHNMSEFRRGGDQIHAQPFETYVTEQIESKIDAGNIKYDWKSHDSKHQVSIFSSAQLVDRNSYYGAGDPVTELTGHETPEKIENFNRRLNSYGRTKGTTFSVGGQYSYELDKLLIAQSRLTAGTEYMEDEINDNSGYRPQKFKQSVNQLSLYAQNEWKKDHWNFYVGLRADKHSLLPHIIFNPRSNLKYAPSKNMSFRFNYGQGFRAPQLFDEDLHVDIAGGQHIITQLSDNLKEEKSHSFSLSSDWTINHNNWSFNFVLEGFYTILNNPFTTISEEQEDGSINRTVINTDQAKVHGLNFESTFTVGTIGDLQVGATIQESKYSKTQKWIEDDNIDASRRILRTPNLYGYFISTLNFSKRMTAIFSGNYTGSMLVPHESGYISENRTVKTPSFVDFNCKLSYSIAFYKGVDLEMNGGVQNIFNAFQKDLDRGKNRASSYVYGPALPRSYFVGFKLNI